MNVTFRRPPAEADIRNGVRVPYAAPRRKRRWAWYLLLLIVASPLLWFIGASVYHGVTITAPGYIAMDHVEVTAVRAGVVTDVRVGLGAHVQAGQLVTVLRDPELEARRAAIAAQLDALTAVPARAGMTPPTAGALAADRVARAAALVAKYRFLAAHGAATVADTNDAQGRLDAAQSDALALQTPGAAPVSANFAAIVAMRSDLAGIDAQRAALRARVSRAGVVIAIGAPEGAPVAAGDTLVTIALGSAPHVVAFVEPRDVQALAIGRGATVTLANGDRARAHVVRVARLAHPLPTTFVSPLATRPDAVEVTFSLDEPLAPAGVVDGLPVSVHVDGFRL